MDKDRITTERKDEIIEGLLGEYLTGITQDGLDCLLDVMSEQELAAYGYDLSEIEPEGWARQ